MDTYRGCVVRPHSMGYGAHASIYGIRWHRWGGGHAVGFGHLLWHRTVSEPGSGPYAAKVAVSEPAECGGRIRYSRLTIKIGRRHGRTLQNNEAFGACYYP